MKFNSIQGALEYLKNNYSTILDIIEKGKKCLDDHPTKTAKPRLVNGTTDIKIIEQHLNDMKEWNEKIEKYNDLVKKWDEQQYFINSAIEELIREESGLNDIPEQYRDRVYSYAYREGHSSGYYEVYLKLCELVEIFKE